MNRKTGKRILTAVIAFVLATGCLAGCGEENLEKTYEELDTMMAKQPVVVTGYKLSRWETIDNSGPMLQPLLQNNSEKAVTSIELAIAMWDAQGQPVKVIFDDGTMNTANVAKVTYNDCDFSAGSTYGDKIGLALSEKSVLPERIQAVPVKWTYEDGTTEENLSYKYWTHKYQNQPNAREDLANPQFAVALSLTEEELNAELKKQPLVVAACEMGQWEQGDLLCATVKNNGEATISSMLLAFATFDAEGNPICITWSDGKKAESNVVKIRMKDIALAYGGEYGADKGIGLHADSEKVASFVAIPYYYEDLDGNAWENPLYESWLALYKGK